MKKLLAVLGLVLAVASVPSAPSAHADAGSYVAAAHADPALATTSIPSRATPGAEAG